MEKTLYTPDELVKKLVELSGLNQKELANVLGIAPQTLSNWSVGKTKNFDAKLITTVGEAMRNNPRWGIRLGTITRSKIEIVENKSSQNTGSEDTVLANNVIKHYIKYTERLEKEIETLKEELSKYTSE